MYQPWETWEAWLHEYRALIVEVQAMAEGQQLTQRKESRGRATPRGGSGRIRYDPQQGNDCGPRKG
jgi:hypothetical protein